MDFLKNLKSSLYLLLSKYTIYSVIVDVLFVFIYGFATAPFFAKILEFATAILSFISQYSGAITRQYTENPSILQIISTTPTLRSHLTGLILVFLSLAVVVFLLYCIFQLMSWRFAGIISGRKSTLYEYGMRFTAVTIPFFLIFMIVHVLSFFNSLAQIVSQRTGLPPTKTFITWIYILSFFMIYFGSIAYALILRKRAWESLKMAFSVGFKQAGTLLPYVLVMIAVFFVINKILVRIPPSFLIPVGIILVFPAITWARVLIITVVNRVCCKD